MFSRLVHFVLEGNRWEQSTRSTGSHPHLSPQCSFLQQIPKGEEGGAYGDIGGTYPLGMQIPGQQGAATMTEPSEISSDSASPFCSFWNGSEAAAEYLFTITTDCLLVWTCHEGRLKMRPIHCCFIEWAGILIPDFFLFQTYFEQQYIAIALFDKNKNTIYESQNIQNKM